MSPRIYDEVTAVGAGNDGATIAGESSRVGRMVDSDFIFMKVDDDLERSARYDVLPLVPGEIAQIPVVVDVISQWGRWSLAPEKHRRDPIPPPWVHSSDGSRQGCAWFLWTSLCH